MAALRNVLEPLATLAVQRGLPYAAVEELLRRAFIGAADAAHPDVLAHRKVSRLATTTTQVARGAYCSNLICLASTVTPSLPSRPLTSTALPLARSDALPRTKAVLPL